MPLRPKGFSRQSPKVRARCMGSFGALLGWATLFHSASFLGWEEQLKQEKPSLSSVLFGMSSGILGLAVFLQFLNSASSPSPIASNLRFLIIISCLVMCQMVPSIVLPYLINWITFDQAQVRVSSFFALFL